jgi:hypothetical protein
MTNGEVRGEIAFVSRGRWDYVVAVAIIEESSASSAGNAA